MGNRLLFAIPLMVVLAGLSTLHAYWAMGGRWASAYTVPTVNGRRTFDPSPLATWAICALLAIGVLLVAGKAGWLRTGAFLPVLDAGVWILGLVFLLRALGDLRTFGFFKTLKGSPFADWDTWLYSPLCLLIAVLVVGLASSQRNR